MLRKFIAHLLRLVTAEEYNQLQVTLLSERTSHNETRELMRDEINYLREQIEKLQNVTTEPKDENHPKRNVPAIKSRESWPIRRLRLEKADHERAVENIKRQNAGKVVNSQTS